MPAIFDFENAYISKDRYIIDATSINFTINSETIESDIDKTTDPVTVNKYTIATVPSVSCEYWHVGDSTNKYTIATKLPPADKLYYEFDKNTDTMFIVKHESVDVTEFTRDVILDSLCAAIEAQIDTDKYREASYAYKRKLNSHLSKLIKNIG